MGRKRFGREVIGLLKGPNIDKTLAENRMSFLLKLKDDLRENVSFSYRGVANAEQSSALDVLFESVDQMLTADAKYLASDECKTVPRR